LPHATREPLQFGAEIYGHAGIEADLEAQALALAGLQAAGLTSLLIDMADVRIVSGLLVGTNVLPKNLSLIHAALAAKDAVELGVLTAELPQTTRTGLQALLQLYGDESVLDEAAVALKAFPGVQAALENLRELARHIRLSNPGVDVRFDLADLRGYAYYSGTRFAIYGMGAELARGGRYDEVGAVFGRNRPAVGFSLDLKELVRVLPARPLRAAVKAPWGQDAALSAAITVLRQHGETVTCVLPGHEHEVNEFNCDRELLLVDGQWQLVPLSKSGARA
jgi:ATP phosphoribosyltransferase regulatory subunit